MGRMGKCNYFIRYRLIFARNHLSLLLIARTVASLRQWGARESADTYDLRVPQA